MRSVLAAAVCLLLASCGGANRPAELRTFDELRDSEAGTALRARYPKLLAEADQHRERSELAFRDGTATDARHHARLAQYTLWAASAYSRRKDLQLQERALANERRIIEEKISVIRRRERVALEVLERDERLRLIVERSLVVTTDAANVDLRPGVSALLVDLKDALDHDAARLAPTDEIETTEAVVEALTRLGDAQTSLPSRAAALERAAERAKHLVAVVLPRFALERARAAEDERLTALLEAAAAVPGAEARLDGRGLVITLRQLFADGETSVMPEKRPLVDAVAALIRRSPESAVVVDVHTEARKDALAAVTVSASRAAAVLAVLVAAGVSSEKATSNGRGGEEPVDDNGTRVGRTRNRRVEIVVLRTVEKS
ncbi:MAG: hypothetical protein EXR76_16460 [Myxococcales bacterium]|nr:hypothetical protein [Myxococcales bacterium]